MCAFLFLVLGTMKELSAQNTPDAVVARIYNTIRAGDFTSALALADSTIADYKNLSPDHLAKLHATRALLQDFFGDDQKAANELTLAAQLDPALELDPLFYSPGLRAQFEELRKKYLAAPNALENDIEPGKGEIRYISVPDPRINAAWRSLVLPGWGQFYKKHKIRGYLLGGLTLISGLGAAGSYALERSERQKYLAATGFQEIQSLYDDYNQTYRLRRTLSAVTAVLWGANFLDAVFSPKSHSSSLTIQPVSTDAIASTHGLQINLRVEF